MELLIGEAREWRRELAAAVALGVFFGVLGPFGTFFNDTVAMRIAAWVGMMVMGVVIYGPALRVALAFGARWRQPVWFVLPMTVLVVAIPASALTAVIVTRLWPRVGPFMRPIDWYGQAVILGLPLSALAVWSRWALRPAAPRPPVATPAAAPAHAGPVPVAANDAGRLLDRLPPRLGRTLLCLQMEDHYVRVHTDQGSELVLLPLKAAMAEVEAEGLQVHRSWWVARTAVAAVVQDGRNLRLKLVNGLEPPVSRSSVAALRSAGWLEAIHTPESNRRRVFESDG